MTDREPTLAEQINRVKWLIEHFENEDELVGVLASLRRLQAERERAEKAESELAALKEALRNCRKELWWCNEQLKRQGYREGADVTEALADAAHILKD